MSDSAGWFLWVGLPVAAAFEMFVVGMIVVTHADNSDKAEAAYQKTAKHERNRIKWEAANHGKTYELFQRGYYYGKDCIPVKLEE